jgi:hypothetical protein
MPKSSGRCLGRSRPGGGIMAGVSGDVAQLELSIDVDSDPITGSVTVGGESPHKFSGWIELVAAIETARNTSDPGGEKSLGSFPGANGGAV